jgi:hypothetical protein
VRHRAVCTDRESRDSRRKRDPGGVKVSCFPHGQMKKTHGKHHGSFFIFIEDHSLIVTMPNDDGERHQQGRRVRGQPSAWKRVLERPLTRTSLLMQ